MAWCPDWNKYKILGRFQEKTYGKIFEYIENTDTHWVSPVDFPHRIFVTDGTRYAKVLLTVAYVVVDEAPDGSPIVEKWNIKDSKMYFKVKPESEVLL